MTYSGVARQTDCDAAPATGHGHFFAQVLEAQRDGKGVLPFFLGLQPLEMFWLTQHYTEHGATEAANDNGAMSRERGELRQQLLELRHDEWQDLRVLLKENCAGLHPLESAMAAIVAAGCLGGDHLWRDLGLATRAQLSELLTLFFPQLAAKNTRDMKWKKFFYKQLCEQEGGYVCRAPSCEECAAYDDCFGEEV